MENLPIQWKTEEENRKIGGGMSLIDRELGSNLLLINRELGSNMLFINRKLAKLENDAKCALFPKLIELVIKSSNLTRTGKEKSHRPIFLFLARFIEPIRQLCFCFAENLTGLTDGLAMGGAKLRREKVTISFFECFLWNVEIIFQRYMTAKDGS